MDPPSCLVDVYADEGYDTAKRLHYKVPVLGVEQYTEIYINLSLRPRHDKSKKQLKPFYIFNIIIYIIL